MKKSLPALFISFLALFLMIQEQGFAQSPDIKIGTGRTKRTINIGDSISIWWKVENANKFYCNELGLTDMPMEGVLWVSPTQNTSYVFIAERGGAQAKKRIAIDVVHPKLLSFTAPDRITDEGVYTIAWTAENADYVSIYGIDEKLPAEGKVEFRSTRDTTIRIAAWNKAGYNDKMSKKVKVNYVESIGCTSVVKIGEMALVEWKYKNAYKIAIDHVNDSLPPIGSMKIPMKTSYSYGVQIFRNDGTVDDGFFNIQVIEPKIVFFNGKTFVRPDEMVEFTWHAENADSVTLSVAPGVKHPPKGKFSFQTKKDTDVVLKAYLNGYTDERTLRVEIDRSPAYIEPE